MLLPASVADNVVTCHSAEHPCGASALRAERRSIQRILEHLGEPTRPPPRLGPCSTPRRLRSIRVDAFASRDPLPLYEFDQRASGYAPPSHPPWFLPIAAPRPAQARTTIHCLCRYIACRYIAC
jgi:hypothetical protein